MKKAFYQDPLMFLKVDFKQGRCLHNFTQNKHGVPSTMSGVERACRKVQLEARYLVKDLEVQMKEEMIQLAVQVDEKITRQFITSATSLQTTSGTTNNTDHSQIVTLLENRMYSIRDDLQAQLRQLERKLDTQTRALSIKLDKQSTKQNENLDQLEASLSAQINGMAEDTQDAFAAAFVKYDSLEKSHLQLQKEHKKLLTATELGQSSALFVEKGLDNYTNTNTNTNTYTNTQDTNNTAATTLLSPTTTPSKQIIESLPEPSLKPSSELSTTQPPTSSPTSIPKQKSKKSKKSKKEKARRYKGPESIAKIPTGSVGQHMLMSMRSFGSSCALIEASNPEINMSFRAVINQVKACAIGLLYCGMSDESVILVALPSIPHVPIVALATTLIGGTCVPINPDTLIGDNASSVISRLKQDTKASALFVTHSLLDKNNTLSKHFQLTITISLSDDDSDSEDTKTKSKSKTSASKHVIHGYDELLALGRANSKKVPPPAQVNGAKSIGFMVPTQRCEASLDRLVGLTHQAVISILVGVVNAKEFASTDTLAVAVPFWDARALFGAVLPALLSGTCVVCPGETNDPATLFMFLTDHSVTQLWVNVQNLRFIAKHHSKSNEATLGAMLPTLKRICCVEAASSHILHRCVEACSGNIQVGINSSPIEMGGRIMQWNSSSTEDILRTQALLPGIECKILHPATRKMCAPGKRGIVCLKGPSMMAGKSYASSPDSNCLYVQKNGVSFCFELYCNT